jgi:hypothetical protein
MLTRHCVLVEGGGEQKCVASRLLPVDVHVVANQKRQHLKTVAHIAIKQSETLTTTELSLDTSSELLLCFVYYELV